MATRKQVTGCFLSTLECLIFAIYFLSIGPQVVDLVFYVSRYHVPSSFPLVGCQVVDATWRLINA